MYLIAIKMLVGDRAKYLMLVSALSFASLLMNQQSAIFTGLMRWTTATIRNTDIPIWVVDPNVEQVNEVKPMRDTDLARVRSVNGVAWALPFYFSLQQARLYNGKFKSIQLLGVDSSTLIGSPAIMLEGKVEDLWKADAVIIDQIGLDKINQDSSEPLGMGDTFDINDHEARIVGIAKVEQSFFGYPFVYTTYDRAIEFAPETRRNLSFILVNPLPGVNHQELVKKIQVETGLRAFTEEDFFWSTIWWFVRNTGIPVSFGMTILLGFIVGIAVSGQTFYSFILENLGNLGALKAMGASNQLLRRMLLLQAALVGVIGYGIGIGLASLFGYFALEKAQPPFYMPWQIPLTTFFTILFICAFSAFLGIRKISQLEPAEVFRA